MKKINGATAFVNWLWESSQLEHEKNLKEIQDISKSSGYTFSESALRMALNRSRVVTSFEKNQVLFYRQKHPSKARTLESRNTHILNSIHPEINKVCSKLFNDGHYPQAISEAFKKVNTMVKNKSGESSLDGKKLMLRVFSVDSPILKINQLQTQSDKDEQEGFMHLFAGAVQGIRNPHAHENIINNDPITTLEHLCLASLLAKIVDKSTK